MSVCQRLMAKSTSEVFGLPGRAPWIKALLLLEPVDSQAESYVITHTDGRPSGPEDS